MKNLTGLSGIFLILLPLAGLFSGTGGDPGRHALIVAVGSYPAASRWPALHSANDAELIRSALMRKGFQANEITLLQDGEATFSGIQKAFEKLIDQTKPGDMILFHFSGHGQQVSDDNGDEPDGYDEAIVPYDSPLDYQAGVYEGERLLRDDELGILLHRLRQKAGPEGQVVTILDACHSGTATRGLAITRGSAQKMASSSYLERHPEPAAGPFGLHEDQPATEKQMAPLISLSATGANELNYEYRDPAGDYYGSLSYAFSKVFLQLPEKASFQGLFDKIRMEMSVIAPRQTPQAEGDLNLSVFEGRTHHLPRHADVLRCYDPYTLIIDAGTLAGIHPGTTLTFYPIDTRDTAQTALLFRGTVVHAFPLIAEVRPDRPVNQGEALASWGFVERRNFGDIRIRLALDLPESDFRKRLVNAIQPFEAIQVVVSEPDLILEQQTSPGGQWNLSLRTKDDLLLPDLKTGKETDSQTVIERILTYGQAVFLRQLELENPYLYLEVEIIPVTAREEGTQTIVQRREARAMPGRPESIPLFRSGDSFLLRVTNKGTKGAYFSILDLSPDYQLQVILPNPFCRFLASDLYIQPGQQMEIDCIIDVFPPTGMEMLKLIATEQKLDLGAIVDTRGKTAEEVLNPFERLFRASFKMSNRGAATPSIPSGSAQVSSLIFRIID